ncbi:unnamed protein product, partial [Rotaria magnacalcarata]
KTSKRQLQVDACHDRDGFLECFKYKNSEVVSMMEITSGFDFNPVLSAPINNQNFGKCYEHALILNQVIRVNGLISPHKVTYHCSFYIKKRTCGNWYECVLIPNELLQVKDLSDPLEVKFRQTKSSK